MRVLESLRTILSLSFSPDDRILASAGWTHVALWNMRTGKDFVVQQSATGGYCHAVQFSTKGTYLSWLAQRQAVQGFEVRVASINPPRQLPDTMFRRAGGKSWRLGSAPTAFVRDDLLVATDQSAVFMVGSKIPVPYVRWNVSDDRADQLVVRPDREEIAIGDRTGLKFLKIADWSPTGEVELDTRPVHLSIDPDGRVAAVTENGLLVVSDVKRPALAFEDNRVRYRKAEYTPNGRFLVTTEFDGEVIVFDTRTWAEKLRMNPGVGGLEALAVSHDGFTAAVSGFCGAIAVFDLDD